MRWYSFRLTVAAAAAASAGLGVGVVAPAAAAPAAPAPVAAAAMGKTVASGSAVGQVVILTNAQRKAHGCPPLSVNSTLAAVAGAHSRDMAVRGFFAHVNPEGKSPFDRMTAAGYRYRRAAENIAAGYATPKAVVTGWMNSPGHRKNILNCSLIQVGVGYATGGSYGTYWTQDFGTPR